MRTAEIRAWNYGARVRAAGAGREAVAEPALMAAIVPFTEVEAEAEITLGMSIFRGWALRGWDEAEPASREAL